MLLRNLWSCKSSVKEVTYKSLVRPQFKHACAIGDLHLLKDIRELEMVQRRAARFICKDYRQEERVMTGLLSKLEWPTLQERRTQSRLTLMHKLSALDIHDDLRASTRNTCRPTNSFLTSRTLLPRKTATNTSLFHASSQSGITSLPTRGVVSGTTVRALVLGRLGRFTKNTCTGPLQAKKKFFLN